MGAWSWRRLRWDKKIWRALTQSCRISASDSWTCFPPFPSNSLLIISSNTPLSIIPSIVIIFINSCQKETIPFALFPSFPSQTKEPITQTRKSQKFQWLSWHKNQVFTCKERKRNAEIRKGSWAICAEFFWRCWIGLDWIWMYLDCLMMSGINDWLGGGWRSKAYVWSYNNTARNQ